MKDDQKMIRTIRDLCERTLKGALKLEEFYKLSSGLSMLTSIACTDKYMRISKKELNTYLVPCLQEKFFLSNGAGQQHI